MKSLFPFCSLTAGLVGLVWLGAHEARAADAGTVPKWWRFEKSFSSTVAYTNPIQQAELSVELTSPGGAMSRIYGFWDGGSTWRFRFAPDAGGEWHFNTTCSDPSNTGLHGKKGSFVCTPPEGDTRFQKHGPVRVSADGHSLAHSDGTPFLWLANTSWAGTSLTGNSPTNFNAVQWLVTPFVTVSDAPYAGTDKITINPGYFEKLDKRVVQLEKAGLLNAPVLLGTGAGAGNDLPLDQAAKLARYMVARWQASPSFWILSSGGHYFGSEGMKWKQVGRAVFGGISHAPVALLPQSRHWIASEFRDESWMNVVGYHSGSGNAENSLRWLNEGPVTKDWQQLPARPFINLEPVNELAGPVPSQARLNAEDARRALFWSLLNAPTAGVTSSENLGAAATFFGSFDFSQLRPSPGSVVNNPGVQNPRKFIALARTEKKDVTIAYVPEDRTVEILLEAFPPAPDVKWFNPRTGEKSPAVGVVTERSCQFPTPGEGDWILIMHTQQKPAVAPGPAK